MGVLLARAATKSQTCVLLIVCGVHCVESSVCVGEWAYSTCSNLVVQLVTVEQPCMSHLYYKLESSQVTALTDDVLCS